MVVTPKGELTPRQKEVLATYVRGGDRKRTGEALFITEHTVARHLEDIYQKLGVNNVLQAIDKLGWLQVPEDY